MDNVTLGVATVSQTGATHIIEGEYADAEEDILDTFVASVIHDGVGISSGDLEVDKEHQWVSVISKQFRRLSFFTLN